MRPLDSPASCIYFLSTAPVWPIARGRIPGITTGRPPNGRGTLEAWQPCHFWLGHPLVKCNRWYFHTLPAAFILSINGSYFVTRRLAKHSGECLMQVSCIIGQTNVFISYFTRLLWVCSNF